MRTLKILLLILFPAILVAQKAPLTAAEISGFKQEVASKAENIENLSSDFTQTKHIQLMEEKSVSTGKLYYKSPNVLKWEYKSPYDYIIVFKENKLHINDNGDKSTSNLKSNKLFEKLVALISGSVNGKLLADPDNYDVSYYRSGKMISAVIVPKDPALKEMFREIILVFNQKHHVDSVQLMEEEGDYTKIEFKNIKMNKELDDSIFKN